MTDSNAHPEMRTPRGKTWLCAAVVIAAGVLVYANTFSAPIIFDGISKIVENPAIRHVWPPEWRLPPAAAGFKAKTPANAGDRLRTKLPIRRPWGWLTYDRRPVAYLSFALNYAIHGLDVWGYHAVNLGIHLAAALVLFGIVGRTLSRGWLAPGYRDTAWKIALAIALIWMLHPLQTQSVTYIVQRIESLMGLFYLLTLYAFIRARDSQRSGWWYAVSVVSCGLGMATKEVAATAPLIVLWYDRVFVADSWRDLVSRRGKYYAVLCANWGLLAYLMITRWSTYGGNAGLVADLSPLEYALSQPGVLLHYLRLCVWPTGQCLDYWWPAAQTVWEIVPPLAIIVGLLAVTISCIWRPAIGGFAYKLEPAFVSREANESCGRRQKHASQAWGFLGGWFFLILAPTSSVMPIRDLAFEHRMYLPLAAVAALFVLAGSQLSQRVRSAPLRAAWQRAWWFVVLPLVILGLGGMTVLRNEVYRTQLSVWQDVVAKAPHNPRAHYNLGRAMHDLERFQEAIEIYRGVLRLDPDYLQSDGVLCDLGAAFQQLGELDEAILHYRKSLSVNPGYAKAHTNLGVALIGQGRTDEAIAHFRESVRLEPRSAEFHTNLAQALRLQAQLDEAVEHYRRALELDPRFTRARSGLDRLQSPSNRP